MSNYTPAKTANVPTGKTAASAFADDFISIRVSPNSYFIALFLTTFLSGFLIYLEQDFFAVWLLAASWLTLPLLAYTDRITFDGKRLARTGFCRAFGRGQIRRNTV